MEDLEAEEKRLEKLLKEALETGDYEIYINDPKTGEFKKIDKVIKVKAHYRNVNGKKVYIKPYYRRKPKNAKKTKP